MHPTVNQTKAQAKNRGPLTRLERKNRTILKSPDKVAIAMATTAEAPNLEFLDLRSRISELADFLRGAGEDPSGAPSRTNVDDEAPA